MHMLYSPYGDSPYELYSESLTICTNNTRSRRFSVSTMQGVFLNSVDNFFCQWYGESATIGINKYAASATSRIVKSWEPIFDYEYLCEFEAKIRKVSPSATV